MRYQGFLFPSYLPASIFRLKYLTSVNLLLPLILQAYKNLECIDLFEGLAQEVHWLNQVKNSEGLNRKSIIKQTLNSYLSYDPLMQFFYEKSRRSLSHRI